MDIAHIYVSANTVCIIVCIPTVINMMRMRIFRIISDKFKVIAIYRPNVGN